MNFIVKQPVRSFGAATGRGWWRQQPSSVATRILLAGSVLHRRDEAQRG